MVRRRGWILLVLLLGLFACTPGGSPVSPDGHEESGAADNQTEATETASAADGAAENEGEMSPEEPPATTSAATSQSSPVPPSGVVDLSTLTPDAGQGEGTLEVMPQPGTPLDGILPPDVARLASAIRCDVAEQLGVSETDVAITSVEEEQWPDASLGCPEPGAAFAQVITPGYRLVVSAASEELVYHSDSDSQYVWCVDGTPAARGSLE